MIFQMSKTVKKLEKENASLKKKCEKSDVSIIELLEEVTAQTSHRCPDLGFSLCISLCIWFVLGI
jgi:hypothetical protein